VAEVIEPCTRDDDAVENLGKAIDGYTAGVTLDVEARVTFRIRLISLNNALSSLNLRF
jgi:hypothetical protein